MPKIMTIVKIVGLTVATVAVVTRTPLDGVGQ